MKPILSLTACLGAALLMNSCMLVDSALAKNNEKKDGKPVQIERFQNETIDKLSVSGVFSVELVQKGETGIKLEIDDRLQEYLICELKDGKLKIGFTNLPSHLQSSNKLACNSKARISVSSLDRLNVSGVSSVNASGNFTGNDTQIKISGVSSVSGLNLRVNGNSAVNCSGVSKMNNCSITRANELKVDVSGTSKASLTCDVDSFRGDASGVAKLNVSGKAKQSNVNKSGASSTSVNLAKR